ncbi:sensor histidine kinase [Methanoculleus sediminis]|uniref:sensor histidine kinase n=1 Tax=Methanoculleus sediminis TaxID=1550566 RepID=UPI000A6DAD25|nr:PAS domain-containing sensor histidine kinase [Methanoculleus sediminis]
MQGQDQQSDTSTPRVPREKELLRVLEELYGGFSEAEETLSAIRQGEVDAFVVSTTDGEKIYTLNTAEHPYRVLIEQMREGAALVSADGTILYSNASFARLLHMPLGKVMGESIHTFIVSPETAEFRRRMKANPSGTAAESTLQAQDGRRVPVYLSLKPLSLDGVQVFSLVALDLTERKQAEEAMRNAYDELDDRVKARTAELAQSNARLVAANRDLQTLTEDLIRQSRNLKEAQNEANLYLDILTHDIGNTENVANLYADLLLGTLSGEGRTYVEKLKRSIDKSIEILGTVSKIRRIHAGTPELKPVDLDAAIREEIGHYPEGIIRYTGSAPPVRVDDLLPEVVGNLIGNAVKHGGPDVAVTIRTEDAGEFVRISVEDTGPGVPDDQKEEIFHRYEQQKRGVGEGLGLYLVQVLIERYGGRVWVEDRVPGHPERGAAFVFTLKKASAVHE